MSPLRRAFAPSSTSSWSLLNWRRAGGYVVKAFLLYHVFTSFIGGMVHTQGISMMPTIPHSYRKRPWILYSTLHRRGRNIKVGDIITYTNPVLPHEHGCKRVIGMPGDFVSVVTPGRREADLEKADHEGDWANVKEQVVQVPEGHCWIVGDNMEWSRDSRLFGPLPLGLIKSKVIAVVFPFSDAKWLGAASDVVDYQVQEKEAVVQR